MGGFKFIVILLSLFISLYSNDVSDSEMETLFAKAFGSGTELQSSEPMDFPVFINNSKRKDKDVLAKITDGKLYLKKDDLEYLLDNLKKECKKNIKFTADKDGFVDISKLNLEDIKLKYDDSDLSIKYFIPPRKRKPTILNFGYKPKKYNFKNVKTPISGALNLHLYETLNKEKNKPWQTNNTRGSSDIFINYNNYVLENDFSIDYKKKEIIRTESSIIKDFPKQCIRTKIGDQFLPSQNKQSYVKTLGFSVEKSKNLADKLHNNFRRRNYYSFFLETDSEVEVYVNNFLKKRLKLPAGQHEIEDLGLPSGVSDVKIKIIGNNGKTDIVSFKDFKYGELLEKNKFLYGIGLGIASKNTANGVKYFKKDKILSGYLKYGFFDNITVDLGIQLSNKYKNFMSELMIGTKYGFFDFYGGFSKKLDNRSGTIIGMEYKTKIGVMNLSFKYNKRSKNYSEFDISSSKKQKRSTLLLNANAPIFKNTRFNFNLTKNIIGGKETKSFNLKLSKRITKKTNFSFGFTHEKINNNITNNKAYINFIYKINPFSRARYNKFLTEKKENLYIDYSDGYRYGKTFSTSLEKDISQKSINTNIHFKDEKYDLITEYYSNSKKQQKISFKLGTGIAFVNDTFTITKPITSSFVIVKNDKDLKNTPAGIIGYQDDIHKKYNTYTIPLIDYTKKEIEVNENDLDINTEIVQIEKKILTRYKNGFIFKITPKNLYSAKGIIIDDKNNTLNKKTIEFRNITKNIEDMSFTDDNGNFLIENIEDGNYTCIVYQAFEDGDGVFNFTIKKNTKRNTLIDLKTKKVIKRIKIRQLTKSEEEKLEEMEEEFLKKSKRNTS